MANPSRSLAPRFPAHSAATAICLALWAVVLGLAPAAARAQVTYPPRPAEG